jgi:hypothetical protein
MTFHPSQKVKESVQDPVENKQHFNLLPEVNFFVSHKPRLIARMAADPDENEK